MITRTALFTLIIMLAIHVMANDNKGPVLSFEKPEYNFGTVYTDSLPDNIVPIVFTNSGDKPLIIKNVVVCCGTRVRFWPEQPIMPGMKDTVRLEVSLTPTPQIISRFIVITSNCSESADKMLRLRGEVVSRKE